MSSQSPNVKIIGIGGASCSGKTTLAKHLRSILDPNAHILHQDDFAPPADHLPIHPVHNVQDWDDPEGAIEWPLMASALQHCRETGELPPELKSHDQLNILDPVPVRQETLDKWRAQFASLDGSVRFILCDGFIMYWDPSVYRHFDTKLFIREGYDTLKYRREHRNGYFTSSQSTSAAGDHWIDPPGFWDHIVWPAYLKSHRHCFTNGDVDKGSVDQSNEAGKGLVCLDGETNCMDRVLDQACKSIWESL